MFIYSKITKNSVLLILVVPLTLMAGKDELNAQDLESTVKNCIQKMKNFLEEDRPNMEKERQKVEEKYDRKIQPIDQQLHNEKNLNERIRLESKREVLFDNYWKELEKLPLPDYEQKKILQKCLGGKMYLNRWDKYEWDCYNPEEHKKKVTSALSIIKKACSGYGYFFNRCPQELKILSKQAEKMYKELSKE